MTECFREPGPIEDLKGGGKQYYRTFGLFVTVNEMEEEKRTYHCDECGKYSNAEGEDVPECCGGKMREMSLEECVKDPAFAEHARSFEGDRPCDPGTG
jgi:hypothetical protein